MAISLRLAARTLVGARSPTETRSSRCSVKGMRVMAGIIKIEITESTTELLEQLKLAQNQEVKERIQTLYRYGKFSNLVSCKLPPTLMSTSDPDKACL